MDAIILAGGKGTRLQSVVADVPKPMADIAGKPFLEYLLTHLAKYSIDNFVLSVGYKYQTVIDYFGDSFQNTPIYYSIEKEALGTGGAIRYSTQFAKSEDILILNGDTFFDLDIHKYHTFYKQLDIDIVIALKNMESFDRYGSVNVKDNFVTSFEEKGYKDQGYINGGVYILQREIFSKWDEFLPPSAFSFETDFLQKFPNKLKIGAYLNDGYFIDIGIPEDYQKAQKELVKFI
ncbi:MAG: NTP transferase domain-containing protein [Leptospiraceae bacterium]|nr:NTP transferase domain-containing protein [Leptospiraceae bacterium]